MHSWSSYLFTRLYTAYSKSKASTTFSKSFLIALQYMQFEIEIWTNKTSTSVLTSIWTIGTLIRIVHFNRDLEYTKFIFIWKFIKCLFNVIYAKAHCTEVHNNCPTWTT